MFKYINWYRNKEKSLYNWGPEKGGLFIQGVACVKLKIAPRTIVHTLIFFLSSFKCFCSFWAFCFRYNIFVNRNVYPEPGWWSYGRSINWFHWSGYVLRWSICYLQNRSVGWQTELVVNCLSIILLTNNVWTIRQFKLTIHSLLNTPVLFPLTPWVSQYWQTTAVQATYSYLGDIARGRNVHTLASASCHTWCHRSGVLAMDQMLAPPPFRRSSSSD